MTAAKLLAQLLAITPPPPETESVDELLAAAAIMLDARRQLLASATEVLFAGVDPSHVGELTRREDAWKAAITAAQRVVGRQRIGATKLRQYAGAAR